MNWQVCPAPGYDRHFQIGEFYGAELIYIPTTATGPDMDIVEKYVKDPQVKMICVLHPVYPLLRNWKRPRKSSTPA